MPATHAAYAVAAAATPEFTAVAPVQTTENPASEQVTPTGVMLQVAELETKLASAEQAIEDLTKERDAFKSSADYYSRELNTSNTQIAQIAQIGGILDMLPNPPARKTPAPEDRPWDSVDLTPASRMALWFGTLYTGNGGRR